MNKKIIIAAVLAVTLTPKAMSWGTARMIFNACVGAPTV